MKPGIREWYSFVSGDEYTLKDESFFDLSRKPWVKTIECNWEKIRDEIEPLIAGKKKKFVPYYNYTLANAPEKWTIFPLFIWGLKKNDNCRKCPVTSSFLESIPGMTSASFSILKAKTFIKPHLGDSNVMYRCHLGLRIPPDCGINVGGKTEKWQQGKLLAFCDAQRHSAWNNSEEDRLILIIDVLRPEFIAKKKRICSFILATLFWQLIFQKFNIIPHLPAFFRKWMVCGIILFTYAFFHISKLHAKFFS